LVVPKNFSDDYMTSSSKFRTKNRLPGIYFFYCIQVLTYFCNNDNPEKAFCIFRSSQTQNGIFFSRNDEDEKLLELINQYSSKLFIYDARPYINAQANKVISFTFIQLNGGGFENVDYYKNSQLIFCDIGNIHDVSKSLECVYSLCRNKEKL